WVSEVVLDLAMVSVLPLGLPLVVVQNQDYFVQVDYHRLHGSGELGLKLARTQPNRNRENKLQPMYEHRVHERHIALKLNHIHLLQNLPPCVLEYRDYGASPPSTLRSRCNSLLVV